ncbi:L-seryl-tRNA(Sec) selenium transferase [Candidatus Hydrogenedentota bacterium]
MGQGPAETDNNDDPRRSLPSISNLLEEERVKDFMTSYSRSQVMEVIDGVLFRYRSILKPGDTPVKLGEIIEELDRKLAESELDRLRPVINAAGIVLHTGLGRAVLPQRAVDAVAGLNRCCNLQIDLETGVRGKRNYTTERLLTRITGAEAAVVVNNNAGATLLVLAALCEEKEVVVSRGQLIEIGGSFRLPDCIGQSGARMVEVGTTNKTHLHDYERAITEETGALLRVNPSNYRVIGFSKSVSVAELVSLKKKHDVLVIDDLGCGALVDLSEYGLPHEPTVQESIRAGADLVFFSGDKLISGPQAGIIVGRGRLIAKIKKHPLNRMLRVCKLTDTALEHTLRLFLEPDKLIEENPTLRMMTLPLEALKKKANRLRKLIEGHGAALEVSLVEGETAVGGGSMPGQPIKTWLVAVKSETIAPDALCARLRRHEPPVIARIADDRLLVDVRTLLTGEDKVVAEALGKVVSAN